MKKTFTFHTRSRLWILCAAVCMVWAVPLHAQTRRISLNLKNATIQQAVIALQQQEAGNRVTLFKVLGGGADAR